VIGENLTTYHVDDFFIAHRPNHRFITPRRKDLYHLERCAMTMSAANRWKERACRMSMANSVATLRRPQASSYMARLVCCHRSSWSRSGDAKSMGGRIWSQSTHGPGAVNPKTSSGPELGESGDAFETSWKSQTARPVPKIR
jgi:hypothetical protein